jgi:hypothetical protein
MILRIFMYIPLLLSLLVNCSSTPQKDKRLLINLSAPDESEEESKDIKQKLEKFQKDKEKLSNKITNEDSVSVNIVLKNLILKPNFWKENESLFLVNAELRLFAELTEKGLKKNVTYLNDSDRSIDSFDINRFCYGYPNTIRLSESKDFEKKLIDSLINWLSQPKNSRNPLGDEILQKSLGWIKVANLDKIERKDQDEFRKNLITLLSNDLKNLQKEKGQTDKTIDLLRKLKETTIEDYVYSKYAILPVNQPIFSSAKVSTSAPSLHLRLFLKEIDQVLQGTDRTRLEQAFTNTQSQTDILVDKSVLTKATGKKWYDYLALVYGVFEVVTEIYNVMNYDDDVMAHTFILQKDSWYSPRHDKNLSNFRTEESKELKNYLKEKHWFRNENGNWLPLEASSNESEFFIPKGKNVMAVNHLISIESQTVFAQIEIEVGKNELESKK